MLGFDYTIKIRLTDQPDGLELSSFSTDVLKDFQSIIEDCKYEQWLRQVTLDLLNTATKYYTKHYTNRSNIINPYCSDCRVNVRVGLALYGWWWLYMVYIASTYTM